MSERAFPSLDEVYAEVDRIVEAHGRLARLECLGRSDEGREVRAVHVTDDSISPTEKQVAMVVCGRHGNELGTRVVGPAVLRWLTSAEAAPTRQRQQVVVVPVANPDGCARGVFGAPPWHLSSTEQRTIARIARELQPDAIIDVHSFGADDADLQAIVTGNNTSEGEDAFIYGAVAARLVEAATQDGHPFVVHTEKRNEGYNNFIAGLCYDQFHSLAFGLEVNHHALSPEETAAGGLVVVRALLDEGNRRPPWQAGEGYPTDILRGDFFTSVRPLGTSASERRRSRAAIWQARRFFHLGKREVPRRGTVRVVAHYSGDAADAPGHGFTLCCRLRGFPKRITARLNGQAADTHLFTDACSTHVAVGIRPSARGDFELLVEA